jgi:hypothetical protein
MRFRARPGRTPMSSFKALDSWIRRQDDHPCRPEALPIQAARKAFGARGRSLLPRDYRTFAEPLKVSIARQSRGPLVMWPVEAAGGAADAGLEPPPAGGSSAQVRSRPALSFRNFLR